MVCKRRSVQVSIDIGGEHTQRTTRHRNDAVGMVTGTAAIYLGKTSQKFQHELGITMPLGQESQIVGDRGETEEARSALSRALFSQEATNPCRFRDSAPTGSEHDNHPHRDTDGA
jgi:hypothetical protein